MRMASLTLHSNMFLLIRIQEDKTNVDRTFLHSNMFLLIRLSDEQKDQIIKLYIPICFY